SFLVYLNALQSVCGSAQYGIRSCVDEGMTCGNLISSWRFQVVGPPVDGHQNDVSLTPCCSEKGSQQLFPVPRFCWIQVRMSGMLGCGGKGGLRRINREQGNIQIASAPDNGLKCPVQIATGAGMCNAHFIEPAGL